MSQLIESQVSLFPAILTYHLACDEAVVSLLRGWTLGNSPTALRNAFYEVHCEECTWVIVRGTGEYGFWTKNPKFKF